MKASPRVLAPLTALAALVLTSCATTGGSTDATTSPSTSPPTAAPARVVVTTADDVRVWDTQQGMREIAPGTSWYASPASDGQHVYLRERGGAATHVLDTSVVGAEKLLTVTIPSDKPTHVVSLDGRGVIYNDGSGVAVAFDEADLFAGREEFTFIDAGSPHHGVAAPLGAGYAITVPGTEVLPDGVSLRDATGAETDLTIECPGLHGEGTAAGWLAFGCENGVLLLNQDEEVTLPYPDPDGRRVGMFASPLSGSVLAGTYYSAGVSPTTLMLIDTAARKATQIDLGHAFTAMSRTADDDVVVALADGTIVVVNEGTGSVSEPLQIATATQRDDSTLPLLTVLDQTAYLADPHDMMLYAVDLPTRSVLSSTPLDAIPLSVVAVQ